MVLRRYVLRDVDGRGVDHRYQFDYLASCEEAKSVSGSLIGLEGESCGHVVLPIQEHTLIVLIQNHTYLLSLSILSRCVDVVLLPVIMQFELDLLGQRRLYDEIVEPATYERVGFHVGVGHVVLRADFVLLGGDLLRCAWVSAVVLCARERESRERKRRSFRDMRRYILISISTGDLKLELRVRVGELRVLVLGFCELLEVVFCDSLSSFPTLVGDLGFWIL